MELTEQDVKAIAEVRFKLHRELNWPRKYTIPMYSSLTIGFVLVLFLGNFTKSVQPYVAAVVFALLVFSFVVYSNWRKRIKRPWIEKFIQYWRDHKEFMG